MAEEHVVSLFWKVCLANCLVVISILALASLAEAKELTIPDKSQGGTSLGHNLRASLDSEVLYSSQKVVASWNSI